MSETTWAMVRDKRKWRQTLHEATSLQRATLLKAFFVAWRQLREPLAERGLSELMAPFNDLLIEQDRLIAKALAEFRLLGRLVTKHSRQDDTRFFQTVLEEGSHFLGPQQSRDFYGRSSNEPYRNIVNAGSLLTLSD